MTRFKSALTVGYAHLSAWSDLLDRINVFPVPDNDTGTNLRISLAPLRQEERDLEEIRHALARSASGNSGNIAAAFFRELCQSDDLEPLTDRVSRARNAAYMAVAEPRQGTMLSFFDALIESLHAHQAIGESEKEGTGYVQIMSDLQRAVEKTTHELPELHQAGVVDSGALGMYIFFAGFLKHYTFSDQSCPRIIDLFADKLAIQHSYTVESSSDHCIDALLHTTMDEEEIGKKIADLGESVVILPAEQGIKIHVHSAAPQQVRKDLQAFGEVISWVEEKISAGGGRQGSATEKARIHIVTDAAGSMSREVAEQFGITLLDSYILAGDEAKPESLCSSEHIYALLRQGQRVTTAQASTYERHQHYESICRQFEKALYLCVGSAFTGNYAIACEWQKQQEKQTDFTVIDSGAASGRLGLLALLTAQVAQTGVSAEEVIAFAQRVIHNCIEYVFIDELKYLVAGGRVSKAKGFFADLMRMKPIISPTAQGVQKLGVVRNRTGQVDFALHQIGQRFSGQEKPVILLQYSDNEQWIREVVTEKVHKLVPRATLLHTPLSLSSGVHMGPGTWALALAPDLPFPSTPV